MCHENEMGAAKEQHPYIICRLDKQRRWNSGGTVTRPLFSKFPRHFFIQSVMLLFSPLELSCVQSVPEPCVALGSITVP